MGGSPRIPPARQDHAGRTKELPALSMTTNTFPALKDSPEGVEGAVMIDRTFDVGLLVGGTIRACASHRGINST